MLEFAATVGLAIIFLALGAVFKVLGATALAVLLVVLVSAWVDRRVNGPAAHWVSQ